MRRRSILAALTAGGLATIAGCSALDSDDDSVEQSPKEYDLLATHSVYVASDVSLTLPSDVDAVDTPEDATISILPGTTDVGPDTGIDWLASGKAVALVGTEGQSTLVEWMESDAYAETFESGGIGVGSPPPDFLVAFGVDREYVSKHYFTWNDTSAPDDDLYLTALEESLEDNGQ